MQGDGNFVIYNWADGPVWSSNTYGNPGSKLVMQDDGNLVVYRGGTPLWASDTAGEAIGQTPCLTTSSKTFVEPNYDRPGGLLPG